MKIDKAYRRDRKIEKRRENKKRTVYSQTENGNKDTVHHKEELKHKEEINARIVDEVYDLEYNKDLDEL